MKVFHLDCGTMYPPGGKLLNQSPAKIVCHCLLIETAEHLILVDAGVGTADMQDIRRLGPMRFLLNLKRDVNDTAAEQVKRLGYRTADVRHIMITHLDLDHAGGLPDFPQAAVHVLQPEYAAAMNPKHFKERERYRRCHFTHDPQWVVYDTAAQEEWFGLKCIAEDNRLPEGVVLVPLPGHTRGHCGVAVKTPDRWLFHAGDAYYHERRMERSGGCTPGFIAFEYFAHINHRLAMQQVDRLLNLVNGHQDAVDVFCTHDPLEFEQLSALPAGAPVNGTKGTGKAHNF